MPPSGGSRSWRTRGFFYPKNSSTAITAPRSRCLELAPRWRSSMTYGKKKMDERVLRGTSQIGICRLRLNFFRGPTARVRVSVLLAVGSLFTACQAPRPLIEADNLATQIEDEYVAAVQTRLDQWRKEISHSWEKELGYILQREMTAKADANGSISVEEVLRVLALQDAARRKNLQRLDLEAQADRAATGGWRESRRIRQAIRRWMQAGMDPEARDEVFKTVMEVSNK